MNFIHDLEECLRDLAAEARKKHPGVKEASERATLKLRSLQNAYVSAVRKANQQQKKQDHPTTQLFQSSEILHPFLLAANYPNASYRLLEISFKAMRLLMEGDAVVPSDSIHMVRVWMIQAQVVVAYYQKHYAKEIQASEAAEQQPKQQSSAAAAVTTSTSIASAASSWFSWGSSTSSTPATLAESSSSADISTLTESISSASLSTTSAVKNAVSSSSGGAGVGALSSPSQMDALATTILSCLLQLLELLTHYPTYQAPELWTNATSLASLWLHYLPKRHTVQVAARRTVCQIMSLLYQQGGSSSKLILSTWEDLLTLSSNGGSASSSPAGAFSLCKTTKTVAGQGSSSAVAYPPSPAFALELMTQIWKEDGGIFGRMNDALLTRTLCVTQSLLQQIVATKGAADASGSVEKSLRVVQWTCSLLKTLQRQGSFHAECRELFRHLIRPISLATDACRSHDDFEDGYVYNPAQHAWLHQPGVSVATATPAATNGSSNQSNGTSSSLGGSRHGAGESSSALMDAAGAAGTISPKRQRMVGVSSLASLFPQALLWNAGLALEATFAVMMSSFSGSEAASGDNNNTLDWLLQDISTLVTLAETLSDFATIGASCRDHMLQVVDYAESLHIVELRHASASGGSASMTGAFFDAMGTSAALRSPPPIFRKAEQVIASTSAAISSSAGGTSSTTNGGSTRTVLGESLYASVQGVLCLVEILQSRLLALALVTDGGKESPKGDCNKELVLEEVDRVEETFAASLAVLQHYLKRFSGAPDLIPLALKGYTSLAHVVCSRILPPLKKSSHTFDEMSSKSTVPSPPSSAEVAARRALSSMPPPASSPTSASTSLALQRKALLTSLCKLSLPSWGKHDGACQLQDHHVRTLLCLIRILHEHFDALGSEWEMVLWTFEELSVLQIASPLLSQEAYHAALAVSAVLERFALFSTCFSSASLECLSKSLQVIANTILQDRDLVGDDATVLNSTSSAATHHRRTSSALAGLDDSDNQHQQSKNDSSTSSSFGGKMLSMGVRALYGGGGSTVSTSSGIGSAATSGTASSSMNDTSTSSRKLSALSTNLPLTDAQLAPNQTRTRKTYYEDYRGDFLDRLSACKTSVRVGGMGRTPYSLLLLTDVVMANSNFRPYSNVDFFFELVLDLASNAIVARPYCMDFLAMLTMSHLSPGEREFVVSRDKAMSRGGPSQIAIAHNPMQSQLWAVEPLQSSQDFSPATRSQAEWLKPICSTLRTTPDPDVAEAALVALTSILEGVGHQLVGDAVWSTILVAVASLSGDPQYTVVDRASSSSWSGCCLGGFRCLKFLVDDFLDHLLTSSAAAASTSLAKTTRIALLDCCSSFGRSRHDVNVSLTAIGLLWTLADQDTSSTGSTESIDLALTKLVSLASDDRVEVRNASVNTLFSCLVGQRSGGAAMEDGERWKSCFEETIFGVYNIVTRQSQQEEDDANAKTTADGASGLGSPSGRYTVSLHHSRDSSRKQWIVTQVLVLRGLVRVLRGFFPQLVRSSLVATPLIVNKKRLQTSIERVESTVSESSAFSSEYDDDTDDERSATASSVPWFKDAWVKILSVALYATHVDEYLAQEGGSDVLSGRDTLDLRLIGMEILVTCCQLASKAGIQAATTPARVSTNMEVVNGALRSISRPSSPSKSQSSQSQPRPLSPARQLFAEPKANGVDETDADRALSIAADKLRESLFLKAFEGLTSYAEFIVNSCATSASSVSSTRDDSMHILHKFVGGLDRLYECVKTSELAPENATVLLESLADKDDNSEEAKAAQQRPELESRFVDIVVDVLQAATTRAIEERTRYLNQPQRSSLSLLRSMASSGSTVAFERLIEIGGNEFFSKEAISDIGTASEATEGSEASLDCPEEDASDDQTAAESATSATVSSSVLRGEGGELVTTEACLAVSEEVGNQSVPCACKALVLYELLARMNQASDTPKQELKRRRCYKRIVPVVAHGLKSASLSNTGTSEIGNAEPMEKESLLSKRGADLVWKKFFASLSQMLTPIPIGIELSKVSRISDICEIVLAALDCVPSQYSSDLCTVLAFGASKAYQVAKQHESYCASNAKNTEEGEEELPMVSRCKKHCQELLKLFRHCLSGGTSLHPEDSLLCSLTKQALQDSVDVLLAQTDAAAAAEKTKAKAAAKHLLADQVVSIVCDTLKYDERGRNNEGIETLAISVFAPLCRLVTCENVAARAAAVQVFDRINIAAAMERAQTTCLAAEQRAVEAESRVAELTIAIEQLQNKTVQLQAQVSFLESTSGDTTG